MKKLSLLASCLCCITLFSFGQVTPIVRGNNEFSIELYKKLFVTKSNVFVSPYSISAALAMTYAGAKGETEKQMSNVLHFDLNQINTHKGFSDLNKSLESLNNGSTVKLAIANALWKSGVKLNDDYLDITNKYYNAAIYPLRGAGPINEWADKNTFGKIKEIVTESDVMGAKLVLTNAIYFKGEWLTQFKEDQTRDGKFTPVDGIPVTARMMHMKNDVKYFEDEKNQVIELPYKDETMSMTFILPKMNSSISELSGSITPKMISDYDLKMVKSEVDVFIPKFSFTSEFHLAEALISMGMKNAFSPIADFSGICSCGLNISDVIHKAFIEINEKGSEAAAVTAIIMKTTSKERELVFNANRPFMILIKDKGTGSILFMGSIVNPVEKQ